MKEIGTRYEVVVSTAHRAIAVLHDEGLVDVRRGRRASVADHASPALGPMRPSDPQLEPGHVQTGPPAAANVPWNFGAPLGGFR